MISKDSVNIPFTSIYSLCGAALFILLIICLILSLVFLRRKSSNTLQARSLEGDIDSPTYEAEMGKLKVDLSFCDKTDNNNTHMYENFKCGVSVKDTNGRGRN